MDTTIAATASMLASLTRRCSTSSAFKSFWEYPFKQITSLLFLEAYMYYSFVIPILLVVAIAGCTSSPIQQTSPLQQGSPLQLGVVEELIDAPELGIATDLELRVTGLQPGSVAEKSDIQVGDILVELQWNRAAMPGEAQDSRSAIVLDAEGRLTLDGEVVTEPVPLPASTIPPEEYVEMEAIPFTELDQIVSLVGYGFPLKLRLIRDGEEITIQITPGPRTHLLMDLPERTNPEEHVYYYF